MSLWPKGVAVPSDRWGTLETFTAKETREAGLMLGKTPRLFLVRWWSGDYGVV